MKERESVFLKDSIKLEQISKLNEISLTNLNLNNYQSKEEKLFSQKSFLEIILGLVKDTQNNIIMNKGCKIINFSKIRQLLISLKKELLEINEEKIKTLVLVERIKKEKINDFFNSKNMNQNKTNIFPINLNSHLDTLTTENVEIESIEEVSQLKALNFKVKYEIKKVKSLIKNMLLEIDYYKNFKNSKKHKLEIIYVNNNENKIISQILHTKLIDRRNFFIKSANMKNNQDGFVNFLMEKVDQYKSDLKALTHRKNKNKDNSKFYIETINENTENDEFSINNTLEFRNLDYNFNLDKKIIKDNNDSAEKNNSLKDSTGNEETNCNSSEKKDIFNC